MVKNSSSVKAFWLSFLISGAGVLLGPIAATAQIQDTSTPEVALEGSAVPEANPDSAPAAVKIEIPQLAAIASETNSAVDRTLPEIDTAAVDRTL
ncbi:porin, partial [Microcoleus sp. herbarium7]